MERTNQLGKEKVSKLLLKFSIPAIVGMLVNAMYNVIDRIFIGHLGAREGSLGLAGITIGFPIMLITFAFAMLVGVGATSLISIKLGQKKKEEAEKIMGNAITLLVIVSVVLTVLGLVFLDPILKLFGASAEVLPYAKEYMSVILLGTVFNTIGFGMNNFIRADGNPKIAMLTQLIGALLNVVFAPVFLFVFHLGMIGAGLATVVAQAISAIWVVSYFVRGKSSLKIHARNLKPEWRIISKIAAIGTPAFSMQLMNGLLNVILNKSLMIYGGDVAISGMGIINSIQVLMIMPVLGISQGAQPIIGYNFGAKNYKRVKDTLKLAVFGSTIIVLIGYIATRAFPMQFITLFNDKDAALVTFGTRALLIYFFFLPVIGFQIISSNYFQAVGKMKPALLLTLSRQLLILVPAILILPRFYGLDGVLYAGPLADLLSSILTGIWLWKEVKHLNTKHEEEIEFVEQLI